MRGGTEGHVKREIDFLKAIIRPSFVAALLFLIPCLPALGDGLSGSIGHGYLSVSFDDCLARAKKAMEQEGYSTTLEGDHCWGHKDNFVACIVCDQTEANNRRDFHVFVGGTASDGDIPGRERVNLGNRMDNPNTGNSGGRGGATYIGCFKDAPERDLVRDTYMITNEMTVEMCLAHCKQGNYEYAAVQAGNQCFCGNSYGRYGPSNACTLKCLGNQGQNCGGDYANDVYSVSGRVVSNEDRKAPWTGVSRYVGCFKDAPERDLVRETYTITNEMTVDMCAARCRQSGFAYAGLQAGNQCFCGNSYGKFGPSNGCALKCLGNQNQVCGGDWANSIYSLSNSSQRK